MFVSILPTPRTDGGPYHDVLKVPDLMSSLTLAGDNLHSLLAEDHKYSDLLKLPSNFDRTNIIDRNKKTLLNV